MSRKKVTIRTLEQRKQAGTPITMLTAYDYTAAMLVDQAEIDIILVGDSLGMVMLGHDGTVPVTMVEMLHHARAVARGATYALLVGDMPFMSYEVSQTEAVRNAGLFLKEAGMDAVKLEGGAERAETAAAIIQAGIPVMGHIGLTPQSVAMLGGFRVQGKTAVAAQRLLNDALALEAAGCFAIVLEAVPPAVAEAISRRLRIPTLGIGAGAGCDGQVLVYHDLIGLTQNHVPKFVKQYAQVGETIVAALSQYREEVQAGSFPMAAHTYSMDESEEAAFLASLEPVIAATSEQDE